MEDPFLQIRSHNYIDGGRKLSNLKTRNLDFEEALTINYIDKCLIKELKIICSALALCSARYTNVGYVDG